MRANKKKPLYRKVNTKAHGVHHLHGGDFKDTRNRESGVGMRKGIQRGLDYTPLFKFLLAKVGFPWSGIYSEVVSRLDKKEPIYWLVAMEFELANEVVRVGESSYYSGLYVDEEGVLRVVNPDVDEAVLEPLCKCCTHTFNGVPFTRKYGE
ncbi:MULTISPECIES: hypothetical protein [Pseudomonas]|uniref:hypothetical protein n=1 Tax=Pseudomonas TaxID=286 RepID=UPI0009F70D16|nr:MULTISPECIES: hypothetical protein [Pseudomonas]